MNVEGFTFTPPAGFRTEEQTIALRMGVEGPAPSLIVQSKPARAGVSLEDLAGQTFSELSQTIPGMKAASRSEFTFADGGNGIVLAYNFPTATGELRQYFVLRLDKQRLCTVTLTLPSASLTEGNARLFMSALASITPA
jgi:hypothetical protein